MHFWRGIWFKTRILPRECRDSYFLVSIDGTVHSQRIKDIDVNRMKFTISTVGIGLKINYLILNFEPKFCQFFGPVLEVTRA